MQLQSSKFFYGLLSKKRACKYIYICIKMIVNQYFLGLICTFCIPLTHKKNPGSVDCEHCTVQNGILDKLPWNPQKAATLKPQCHTEAGSFSACQRLPQSVNPAVRMWSCFWHNATLSVFHGADFSRLVGWVLDACRHLHIVAARQKKTDAPISICSVFVLWKRKEGRKRAGKILELRMNKVCHK